MGWEADSVESRVEAEPREKGAIPARRMNKRAKMKKEKRWRKKLR